MSQWSRIAHWIMDHGRSIVLVTVGVTLFLGYWSWQVHTDHTAGRFISKDSKAAQDFQKASELFGQSQTLLYLVFDGANPYDPGFLNELDALTQQVAQYDGVESTLSLTNVPSLIREAKTIVPTPLYTPGLTETAYQEAFQSQPFLRGLLLSEDGTTGAMIVKLYSAFNDSADRIDLIKAIEAQVQPFPGHVALAGFPYLRTKYAERVSGEAPLFTLLALLVALLFLYLTFRAWRPVFLPTLIVGLGITWALGIMGLLGYSLNIVTALLPALLVIIGMANAVHLCTKFYDQYQKLQDRRAALDATIRTVGLATFLTCFTTAIGFGVLMLSGSRLLSMFGQIAAIGIMLLYVLSITLIPLAFMVSRPPKLNGAALTTRTGFTQTFANLSNITRRHTGFVLSGAAVIVLIGIVGITQIPSDIFVFSDFYEEDPLRQDLAVVEKHFGGVVPMELVIEAKKPQQFRSLGALRRLERLQHSLKEIDPIGRAMAATDLVKLANQAYFGGNPKTYRLPSNYELPFLQSAFKDFLNQDQGSDLTRNLPPFIDSTFSITRINLGVLDLGTTQMNILADTVRARAASIFPADQYEVFTTGTAILTTRSGENLVQNLLLSLAVALLLISVLMAVLFRSTRLMLISLVPNVIPLLLVGGAMGYAGIPLKPSTALTFSVAFGIAVDSTIHFLAKYRLLRDAGLTLTTAIETTLQETGKAILFTGFILMGGFLVFTLSSFGGTVSMGALTALTLGAATASNLILLPALLYRFGPDAKTAQPEEVVLSHQDSLLLEAEGQPA